MAFLRRLLLYLVGVGLGSVLVYYMLLQDRDMGTWLPKTVIKEKIMRAEWLWSEKTLCQLECFGVDSSIIRNWINTAEIDLSKSEVHDVECPNYFLLDDDANLHNLASMIIQVCDSTILMKNMEVIDQQTAHCICD